MFRKSYRQVMKAIMRALCTAIVAISCSTAATSTFDDRVLCGEWGAYESHWLKGDWFDYLRIGSDFKGTFAYSFGDKPSVFHFAPDDVKHGDGLLVITLHPNEDLVFRLVLSGWRLPSGSALTTGNLFMYEVVQGHEVLVNTIPVRLTPLMRNTSDQDEMPSAQALQARLAKQ